MPPITENERQQALGLIEAANRQMAERARAPGWYHWAVGALVGAVVAAPEAGRPWSYLCWPVFFAAVAALVWAYRRHTGLWISGYRAGRTRWVAIGASVLVTALMVGAILAQAATGLFGLRIAAGVASALVLVAAGYLWEAAYRRDLGVDGR